ncbi:MAG: nucleotidyltransferase family protein [Planctomycetes bacterium]|nr:nucleotidyltransferase family protein [Planctomycetota bacterium]
MPVQIDIPMDKVVDFCRKWKITEFSLFGSVLRDDFRPESDVDVLVEFEPDAPWSLWDWIDMIDELKAAFGRDVDLVSKGGLRNPFRRHAIMSSREIIYAA